MIMRKCIWKNSGELKGLRRERSPFRTKYSKHISVLLIDRRGNAVFMSHSDDGARK